MELSDFEKKKEINENPFLSCFSPAEQDQVIAVSSTRHIPDQTIFIKKGPNLNNEIYLVLKGKANVMTKLNSYDFILNQVGPGMIIGENVLFGEAEWGASIQAITDMELLVMPKDLLSNLIENSSNRKSLYTNLHSQTIHYLQSVNEKSAQLLKEKMTAGFFFANVIFFLCILSLFLPAIGQWLHKVIPVWVSAAIIMFGGILLLLRLIVTKTPLSSVGLTIKPLTWKKIGESIALSGIFLGLVVLIKFFIIRANPHLDKSLFKTFQSSYHLDFLFVVMFGCIYTIHSFFQELLARGALLGMLLKFCPFRKGIVAYAIFGSSFMFATAHVYFGILAVMAVFGPGMLWGYMYVRHQTIYTVWLSHTIIGLTFTGFINW